MSDRTRGGPLWGWGTPDDWPGIARWAILFTMLLGGLRLALNADGWPMRAAGVGLMATAWVVAAGVVLVGGLVAWARPWE